MPDPSRQLTGFRFMARASACAVIAIGLLVLVGWLFEVAFLKSVIPGLTAMNPGGTALAFLLAGVSLWVQTSGETPRRHLIAISCGAGVLLIGLSRVAGFLGGWDAGPDLMLFREALEREALTAGQPNRMSPNTAAAFVLVGLALLWLDAKSRRSGIWPGQILALGAGLVALLTLIGYAYSATSLIGVRHHIPMALNTAVAFAILSVGILCTRPDRGLMAVVSSVGAGGVMARRLLPAAFLIPAIVGWATWHSQRDEVSDQVMGMSLFVLTNIVLFTALIWANAASLDRMDRERRRAERRLQVQYTASIVLSDTPRLDDALPGLLRAICESMDCDEGAIWRLDDQANVLRCTFLWHAPTRPMQEFEALSRQITFTRGVGLPGRVWASGRSAWIPDVTRDPNFPRAKAAAHDGLHGAIGFPIVVGPDVLGVVEVLSREILHPDDELLQMLTAIGSQVGQLIKRKEAEEAVLRERHLLNTLMDTVPDPIYFKDAQGHYVRVNKAAADRFGLNDPEEAIGKTGSHFFDDDLARSIRQDEQAVLATGQPVIGKVEASVDHGQLSWVSTTRMPLRDDQGRIVGTFGISRDITETKRAEEAMRLGEERFRSLIEAAAAIVWNTPASGEFETEQPDWTEYTGQTFEQLKGWGWLDAVHPDDRENTARVWSTAVSGRSLYQVEHRLRRHDGEYRHMLVRAVPILHKDGSIREWVGVHTDIDAETRAEAAVRQAEERARLLLESSSEGIYGIDMEGHCTFVNRAAAQMLGHRVEDMLGRNAHTLFHHSHPDGSHYPVEDCPIFRSFQQGQGCRVDDEVLWRRDGTSFPAEYASSPIRGADGAIKGAVVNFTDITERKKAESELMRANEAAQAATRAKSEFLANMSHEIRTPLNGIIGMTELVYDTELTAEQREFLGMARLSAHHLLTVINDILDFSKIEAGKLDMEMIDFDLRDLLDDTLATLALRAHKKGLELADHVAADVPDALRGDPNRLRQVMVNLVGNAIKFTEQGEVVLHVNVRRQTEQEVCLHFSVTDTGIGIAPDQKQRLFRAFTQADTSTTRKYGGTGLGLAISSRLVEMMGGRIDLDSQVGRGSTFHFDLTFGRARGPTPSPVSAEPAQVHGLAVLVVDDNATNRMILREMLTNWGMVPTLVEGGREALEALNLARASGSPFALVLLDAMMPEMDGFTLAEQIRANSELVGATLMMLSSANRREDAARCHDLHVASYLTKPIRQSILLDAILTALAPSLGLVDASVKPDESAPTETHRPLRLLLAEDNPVNQRLAVSVLEKRGHHVQVVGDGRQALKALEGQAFDAVLMDVQMPEMDGFETTAAIRAREKSTGAHIPIIAMTAHALKGDRERCLAEGMDAYVAKPLRPQELDDVLDHLVPVTGANRESEPLGDFDLSEAMQRVDGDTELLRELAGMFVEECPGRMNEIQQAILHRDAPSLRMSAHALRGSTATFGAQAATEAARRLEMAGRDESWGDVEPAWADLRQAISGVTQALTSISQASIP